MPGQPSVEDVVGTVIHGTLMPEELLTAFFEQLQVMDGERANGIRADHSVVFESLPQLPNPFEELSESEGQRLIMDAGECLEELHDALNENAPEGLFFGSHPGDGSDYGFWPVEGAL